MPQVARARQRALVTAAGPTGAHNAITDVAGVSVGHETVQRPPDIHTGVTAILAGDANPKAPVSAGVYAGNGYGKLIGATQIAELGQLESPIVLTATLSAFRVADAVVSWMLQRDDCRDVRSFNPVVGECNDGKLSDIRARPIDESHVAAALANAATGPVPQGNVGAGTGMIALGFKGGIGTSSRIVTVADTQFTVGALVQANFGGVLRVKGGEVPSAWQRQPDVGSCMVVVATDAPLDGRQLSRVARRGVFGLGRAGASYSHGSGDYGLAVSVTSTATVLGETDLDPIFLATLDCVEESVLDALCAAEEVTGFNGLTVPALSDQL